MKTFWQKAKTIRVIVLGLLIVFSATAPQGYLMLANTKMLPTIPWSLPLLLIYMLLWISFYRGKLIRRGAAYRRNCFRADNPESQKMKWGLITGGLFGVAIFCLLFFLFQAIRIPLTTLPLNEMPGYMAFIYIIMITAVAGISEEVGFRGYIQVPLENMYGKRIALSVTSVFFLLAHLGHAEFNYILPVYFSFSLMLGLIAYHTGSLVPSIIIHFVFDFVVFNTFWLVGQNTVTRQMAETGFTELHIAMVVLMIVGSIGGWRALNKLKMLK